MFNFDLLPVNFFLINQLPQDDFLDVFVVEVFFAVEVVVAFFVDAVVVVDFLVVEVVVAGFLVVLVVLEVVGFVVSGLTGSGLVDVSDLDASSSFLPISDSSCFVKSLFPLLLLSEILAT